MNSITISSQHLFTDHLPTFKNTSGETCLQSLHSVLAVWMCGLRVYMAMSVALVGGFDLSTASHSAVTFILPHLELVVILPT